MVSVPGVDGVDPKRAAVAVVATAVIILLATVGEPLPTLELLGYALATVALGALAFDSVREHPGARVAQTAAIAVALVLIYLAPPRTLLEGAIAAIAVLALAGDAITRTVDVPLDR